MSIKLNKFLGRTLSALTFTLTALNFSAPAHADYITPYGKVGPWKIFHSTTAGDSCAADRDNQNVTLRITYTEYTGDWMIGNPYYNNVGDIKGGFGFSTVPQETLTFSTYFLNGWAMHSLAPNMVNELRRATKLVIELDRGAQVFPLNNALKAMKMVEECARNKGKKNSQNFAQHNQNQPTFQQNNRNQNNFQQNKPASANISAEQPSAAKLSAKQSPPATCSAKPDTGNR